MRAASLTDSAPLLARLWAALAGGELTDPESRALAKAVEQRYPGAAERVTAARSAHAGIARCAVLAGARGVIFGAAGLPVEPQLHATAADAEPGTRFLYADPGAEAQVMRWSRCHLDPRCFAVQASVRDPETILAAAKAARLEPPLHVQLIIIATFWPDDVARETIAQWAGLLSPGDSLALSVSTAGESVPLAGIADVYPHTAGSIQTWLEGAGLEVQPPGVTAAWAWPFAGEVNGGIAVASAGKP